jgi:hypothetical protein
MPLQHYSTIFCDYLIRADNGRFTYAGTFRNITTPEFPLARQFGIAVEFIGEEHDSFKITIEGNGIDLVLADSTIGIPPAVLEYQQSSITVAGQIGLNFAQAGICYVILWSGEQEVHRTPLGIVLTEQEETNVE